MQLQKIPRAVTKNRISLYNWTKTWKCCQHAGQLFDDTFTLS